MLILTVVAVIATPATATDYSFGGADAGFFSESTSVEQENEFTEPVSENADSSWVTDNSPSFSSQSANATNADSDFPEEYARAVGFVIANSIFVGNGNGNYNWESGLTRAELAVLFVRLRNDEEKVNAATAHYVQACYFNDVPQWAKPYVGYCAQNGLMIGYNAYQFGSNDRVTPQQACTVILRHIGLPETEWSYETAVKKATAIGLVSSFGFVDIAAIKRVEMASLIYEAEIFDVASSYEIMQFPPPADISSDSNLNRFTLPDGLFCEDGSIGTLSIPKLNVTVIVYEEENLDNLAKGAGHFKSTSCWEGNVGFAAHNRGQVGYFGQIHTLLNGDKIVYTTKLGTRTYEVYFVGQINETDYSKLGRTDENIVTLITCVNDRPELRWCVQAKEIK